MAERLNNPIETEWPAATRIELALVEKSVTIYGEEAVNPAILALVRARKALADARLSLLFARRFFGAKPEVRHRLEEIAAAIEREQPRFPLTLLSSANNLSRPKIFKAHEGT